MSDRDPNVSTGPNATGDGPPDNSSDKGRAACVDTERRTEAGGPSGPEPTRYGDWERKGRCIDF